MLDLNRVPRKTEQGQQEIAQRSGLLNSGERRLLILADGKRNLQELEKLCRAGELSQQLERLLRLGLITLPESQPLDEANTAETTTVDRLGEDSQVGFERTASDVPPRLDEVDATTGFPPAATRPSVSLTPSGAPQRSSGDDAPAEPADLPIASITLEIQRLNAALESHETQRYEAPPYQASFRQLKEQAAEELLVRSQYRSEVLAARIISCSTPKALRTLLRESDTELARTMGEREAIEFARRIGSAAVNL